MRRGAIATLLCGAVLAPSGSALAEDMVERAALRDAVRLNARAAGDGIDRVPLPAQSAAVANEAAAELAAIGSQAGPVRVLVGARSHAQVPALARVLRRLGARPEAFESIAVLAATVPSGRALAGALRADPRVAYVERDRALALAGEPFDQVDPTSGIKFSWAYDEVHAAEALFATGGGSRRTVAVIDSGIDLSHPDLAGRVKRTYDVFSGGPVSVDPVGHGTFIAGLISAIDGNGIGAKGVAGDTKLISIRAATSNRFSVAAVIRGIEAAIARGADVINMSFAGGSFGASQARALEAVFLSDVLPVASAGNKGNQGNPIEFPAAALGGERGGRGIGLSVTATRPGGAAAGFATHNAYVSVSAPGAGTDPTDCTHGVFSTLPTGRASDWDGRNCSRIFSAPGMRFAYGEGTSFSAPIAAGIAALAWQAERRLASEQVAHVVARSARQRGGGGWNALTGAGVVDGGAAVALARRYDVTAPPRRGRAARTGPTTVGVRLARARDRSERGRELAGRVSYAVLVSRDGGRSYSTTARRSPFRTTVGLRGSRPNVLIAAVCDRNGNCALRRLGRFRAL